MKNVILALHILLLIGFTRCSKDFGIRIDLEKASFIHEIEDCTINPMIEMNCAEWLSFENSTEASVLLGGGDIINVFNFSVVGNRIHLVLPGGGMELVFSIIDNNTLKLVSLNDNPVNTVWIRE